MDAKALIQLLLLAQEVGVPAVVSAVGTLGKDTLTATDITELIASIKPPESYFGS